MSPPAGEGHDGGATAGPAFHFTTRGLPASEQFDAYRAFCAPVNELDWPEGAEDGFPVDYLAWDLGRLVMGDAQLPGPSLTRRWRHLKRDPLDHWCLVVSSDPTPGAHRIIGMRGLARPFEWQACDTRVLTLFIPRELFSAEASLFDNLPGQLPDAGLGRVLGDHLESLARNLPTLAVDDGPALVEATRALLVACLVPNADRLAAAAEPVLATLRERARRVVHSHIRSPLLGPDLLCRELGVSRSRLYRMFEPLGGVVRYIQRQRLLAAHAALSDRGEDRHIVQIAESLGFPDASGFSRAFKGEFGYTPREAREAAHAGLPFAPAAPRAAMQRFTDLGDLLRGLHA